LKNRCGSFGPFGWTLIVYHKLLRRANVRLTAVIEYYVKDISKKNISKNKSTVMVFFMQ